MFTLRISVPRNHQPRGRRYGAFRHDSTAPNAVNPNLSPIAPLLLGQCKEDGELQSGQAAS